MNKRHYFNRLAWEATTTVGIGMVLSAVVALLITSQGGAMLNIAVLVSGGALAVLSLWRRAGLLERRANKMNDLLIFLAIAVPIATMVSYFEWSTRKEMRDRHGH